MSMLRPKYTRTAANHKVIGSKIPFGGDGLGSASFFIFSPLKERIDSGSRQNNGVAKSFRSCPGLAFGRLFAILLVQSVGVVVY